MKHNVVLHYSTHSAVEGFISSLRVQRSDVGAAHCEHVAVVLLFSWSLCKWTQQIAAGWVTPRWNTSSEMVWIVVARTGGPDGHICALSKCAFCKNDQRLCTSCSDDKCTGPKPHQDDQGRAASLLPAGRAATAPSGSNRSDGKVVVVVGGSGQCLLSAWL